MSSVVSQVLYVGRNLKLAQALLSINSNIGSFNISHTHCVNALESILNENDYDYFICELPLSASVKECITEKHPDLECTYLSDLEAHSENIKNITPQNKELVSEEVKAALDCISIPIYYKNKQNVIITCNTYFSQVFGLLPEDLIGQDARNILPIDSYGGFKNSELTMFNEHQVDLLECEMRDVTGLKREFLIREELMDGSELKIGMLFDISEMNSAKRAVEKERAMLRATADISSDLIFFKDLESKFIGCNKQFEAFVGCPEAEIIGKKDDELFEENQALMCQSQDSLAMSTGKTYSGDEYLTYNNGEKHYIFMQKVPLKDKEGNVQGLIGIGRDITEKSIIQKQLKVANVVFENSRDAIVVTDGSGIILSLNDACIKQSGHSKEKFIGKEIRSFATGGDYQQLFSEIEAGLKEKGQWQGNANFSKAGGGLSYFWLEIYIVKHHETGIENRVYSFTDLTQNKYNEEKIQYLSKHDSLTGLNNRIALFTHLEAAIARANHKQIAMGVLFVEIKGYKEKNERYGHHQGDLIIKNVAKRLKRSVSDKDIIARIGDDQFVLVVDELDNEQVVALIAQNIAQQFADPITIEGMPVSFSVSIGISICPDDGMDLNTILSNAESAMLRGKDDRSSSYHFYTNELTINSTHQIELEKEMRFALENDQFEVYYQPQYDLSKHQIVAVECLMRWHHPQQGVLLPNRFLILAEQSGLLIELGMQMFEKAAKQAASWHKSGINFGRIAFNLSKLELSQISLIGAIQKVLLNTNSQASWFEFAIEEHLFSSEVSTVQDNLLNLSRLGVSLTVDGFGADRSVLYSIGRLNIEKFKISKHFIQGVPGYLAGEAMIKSVFVLANSLGIDVVGEGMQEASLLGGDESLPLNEPMKASEATFYLRCHKRK
ncbi:sensor domain-containing protein [Psychromonas algicola]|uniref:sensor domain-containing protein n=1 Tax=Psychromonas algicola TaxID=2555642 RepID=UPI001067F70B|nr:EAL domain-containing protein [Psychromonas sp. RZ5]TEW52066.1 EAL domain-containing protein [Psychromonas sp. RZ5]